MFIFAFSGGGPVLGRRSGGVGQSGVAATENEAPGGMSEDLSGTVFCCEYYTLHRLQLQSRAEWIIWVLVGCCLSSHLCLSTLYITGGKSV